MKLDIRLYASDYPRDPYEKLSAEEQQERLVSVLKGALERVLETFDKLDVRSGLYGGPHQHDYHHLRYFPRPDNVRIIEEWFFGCGKDPYRIYCGNFEDEPDRSGCGFQYVSKEDYEEDSPACPKCGTAVDYKDHDWLEGYTQHQQEMEDYEDGE